MFAKLRAFHKFSLTNFLIMLVPAWRRDWETTKRYCDIGHEIHIWMMDANRPPPCWSEDGRALVRAYIIAYLEYLDAHRFLKRNDEYLFMLMGWLVPFPYHPSPPPKRKRIPPRQTRRDFCKPRSAWYSTIYATISRKNIPARRIRRVFGKTDFRTLKTLCRLCEEYEQTYEQTRS